MRLSRFLICLIILTFCSGIFLTIGYLTTTPNSGQLSYYQTSRCENKYNIDINDSQIFSEIEVGKKGEKMKWFKFKITLSQNSNIAYEKLCILLSAIPSFINEYGFFVFTVLEEPYYFFLNCHDNIMILDDLDIPLSYFSDNKRDLTGKWYLIIFHGELKNNNTQYTLTQYNYVLNVDTSYEIINLYDKNIYNMGNLLYFLGIIFLVFIFIFMGYIITHKKYKNWYFVVRKIQRKKYEPKYIEIEKEIIKYFSKNIAVKPPKEFYEVLSKLYDFWVKINMYEGWKITKDFQDEVRDFHPYIKQYLTEPSKFSSFSEIKIGRGYIEFLYKKEILLEFKLLKKRPNNICDPYEEFTAQCDSEIIALTKKFAFLVVLDVSDIGLKQLSDIKNYFIPRIKKGGYQIGEKYDKSSRGILYVYIPGGNRVSHSNVSN